MARTGMYVLQGVDPTQVAAAPFDVKVVDIYNDSGALHTTQQVGQMGGGPGSALLLGYFSIGEAEVYRDYFNTIPQAALGPENPQWQGNYEVAFWTPEWRAVATAYLDKVIAQGYDGIYFDVVDEYQLNWAQTNAPGGAAGAEQAMADLVAYLANYAHAKLPSFKIWANNAEELLSNSTYFNAIDGMFKENLYYTDSGSKQPLSETQWSLDLMKPMLAAGKDVIAIEYVSTATKVADVQAQAAHDGLGYYTADINLNGVSLTGVQPGQVIHDDWSGLTDTTTSGTEILPPPPPLPPADLVLTGDWQDNMLDGQEGNDTLFGKTGDDILNGYGGGDWLVGGRGNDILTGGAGADTFVFRASGSKHFDKITDFEGGVDHIALDHLIFSEAGAVGTLSAEAFWAGSRAYDANDHVIYNADTGIVYFDPDGTGSMEQVKIADVSFGADLRYFDFLII